MSGPNREAAVSVYAGVYRVQLTQGFKTHSLPVLMAVLRKRREDEHLGGVEWGLERVCILMLLCTVWHVLQQVSIMHGNTRHHSAERWKTLRNPLIPV